MIFQQQHFIKVLFVSSLISLLSACSSSAPSRPSAEADTTTLTNPAAEKKLNAGLSALEQGDTQTAEQIFIELTEAHPKMAAPYANLGMIFNQKGETLKAEQFLKQSLVLSQDNPEAYNHLGTLHRSNGQFAEALKVYQTGLERTPDHASLLLNAGILHDLYLNQPNQALAYYQRYKKLLPDDKQIELWVSDISHRIVTQE